MSEYLYAKELKLENGNSLWWGGDVGWVTNLEDAIVGESRNAFRDRSRNYRPRAPQDDRSRIGKTVRFKRVEEDLADEVTKTWVGSTKEDLIKDLTKALMGIDPIVELTESD